MTQISINVHFGRALTTAHTVTWGAMVHKQIHLFPSLQNDFCSASISLSDIYCDIIYKVYFWLAPLLRNCRKAEWSRDLPQSASTALPCSSPPPLAPRVASACSNVRVVTNSPSPNINFPHTIETLWRAMKMFSTCLMQWITAMPRTCSSQSMGNERKAEFCSE